MKDQLEKEDREKELAGERKMDEQRMAAEKIYWEEKRKEREEKEKAAADAADAADAAAAAAGSTAAEKEKGMETEAVKETGEKEQNEVEL